MFDKFTSEANRVVELAKRLASLHGNVGTEHLLLALLNEDGDGIARKALNNLGVTYDLVAPRTWRTQIESQSESEFKEVPLSPRFKKVMEGAIREVLQLGEKSVDTEHILLGLVRLGKEGKAAAILTLLDVDFNKLRQETIKLVTEKEQMRPAPRPPRPIATIKRDVRKLLSQSGEALAPRKMTGDELQAVIRSCRAKLYLLEEEAKRHDT